MSANATADMMTLGTNAEPSKLDLLHKNLIKFGTLYNSVKFGTMLKGEVRRADRD